MKVVVVGGGIAGTLVSSLLLINGVVVVMVDSGLQIPKAPLIHSKLLRIPSDVKLADVSEDVYEELSQYFRLNLMVNLPSITIIPGACLDEVRRLISLWDSVGVKADIVDWDPRIRRVSNEVMLKSVNGDHLVNIRGLMLKLRGLIHYIRGHASLKVENGKVRVIVNGDTLSGDYVVLTAGAWNSVITRSLNLDVPLQPYKCQAAAFLTKKLDYIVYDYVLGTYMRPLKHGLVNSHIVIAGDGNTKVMELKVKDKVDPIFKREINGKVKLRLGPVLPLMFRYGFCEITPDTMPIVGPWKVEDLYVLGGFDGYGAEVGPALAKALVDYIINGKWHDYAKPYLTERFLSGWPRSWSVGIEAHELCIN